MAINCDFFCCRASTINRRLSCQRLYALLVDTLSPSPYITLYLFYHLHTSSPTPHCDHPTEGSHKVIKFCEHLFFTILFFCGFVIILVKYVILAIKTCQISEHDLRSKVHGIPGLQILKCWRMRALWISLLDSSIFWSQGFINIAMEPKLLIFLWLTFLEFETWDGEWWIRGLGCRMKWLKEGLKVFGCLVVT